MGGAKRAPSSFVQLTSSIGAPRADAGVVERADHLEAREHAQDAVEAPTRDLRVEMAADEDGRERVVRAGAAGEDAAHAGRW